MRKLLLPLVCIILIHCKKAETQALSVPSYAAQEDKLVVTDSTAVAYAEPSAVSEETTAENKSNALPKKTDTISKKIIKNGDMRIQVGNIQKAQNQVNEIIKNNKAYVQKEEFQNTDTDENVYLTIRVPHKILMLL